MLKIRTHNRFEKDYRIIKKRNLPTDELWNVVRLLQTGEKLPGKYRDHQLVDSKAFINVRECHIKPDWLLIYRIDEEELVLLLLRTGTHSDLY
ncbi:MAG: type II toxin-antitoxin system YafQ family toxin [Lachnospiraceae bacterium]|nr:type II toxin-antitoxin system YafQ family toxin [Lachnospiraceae bacterium]